MTHGSAVIFKLMKSATATVRYSTDLCVSFTHHHAHLDNRWMRVNPKYPVD